MRKLTAFAVAVLVGGAGLVAYAQEVKVKAPGTVVQVGPDRGAESGEVGQPDANGTRVRVRAPGARVNVQTQRNQTQRNAPAPAAAVPVEPSFWVGILGGDISPELRAHLGGMLKEKEQGVIIREVVPESPAAEAGLQQHDILLRANGKPITGMATLVEEVKAVGPTGGQVTLDLIRAGRQETKWVKPAERPAQPAVVAPGFREAPALPGEGGPGFFGGLFGGEQPLQLRMFGDGVVIDGGGNVQVQGQANGVSVSVSTVNGKTRVNVKRGDDEWDIDATDPKMLEQLPPDIRAMVEGMLPGVGGDVDINIDRILPDLQGLQGLFERRRARRDIDTQRELEALREMVLELQRARAGQAGGADPGEAPAFNPDEPPRPPAPVEVEIPAEEESEEK